MGKARRTHVGVVRLGLTEAQREAQGVFVQVLRGEELHLLGLQRA